MCRKAIETGERTNTHTQNHPHEQRKKTQTPTRSGPLLHPQKNRRTPELASRLVKRLLMLSSSAFPLKACDSHESGHISRDVAVTMEYLCIGSLDSNCVSRCVSTLTGISPRSQDQQCIEAVDCKQALSQRSSDRTKHDAKCIP